MFKNKRVQILFTPRVPEPEPIVEEPVEALEEPYEEVVGISSAIVESQYKEFILGVVVDYNGIEYDFEWDARNFQLARLSGEKIHPATWQATLNYLTRFFTPRPAPKPVVKEPPVTVPVIEKIVEKVVAPIEEKIASPKPVVVEEEELEASDDELAARARQVLQELGTNNLDLEYMEL